MSGLSETERDGCTKILTSMAKSDLLSLCDTVTNKLIVVENVTGMRSICDRYGKLARMPLLIVHSIFSYADKPPVRLIM